MNTTPSAQPDFPLARSIVIVVSVWCAGVALASAGLGLLGVYELGPKSGFEIMLATAGVCLIASIGFLLPMWWRVGSCDEGFVQGALIGMTVRLGLTFAGALGLIFALAYDKQAVAGWTICWYVLLLITEVTVVVRFLRTSDVTGGNGNGSMENATC